MPPCTSPPVRSGVAACALAFAVALAPAAGARVADDAPLPGEAAPVGRAAPELYVEFCAACHGDEMQGGEAPRLMGAADGALPDVAGLIRIIRDGTPSPAKNGFAGALTEHEIQVLAVLVRETAGRSAAPTPGLSLPLPDDAQRSAEHSYRFETLVDGLDVPWSIAFLPGGDMLYTERTGALFLVPRANGRWTKPRRILRVPRAWTRDEGGLLAVAAHPEFARNRWIYLSFSHPGRGETGNTRVLRARLIGNRLVGHQTIFGVPRADYPEGGVNFGGRLLFDGDYLFLSFGERGQIGQAQDLGRANGKIHRLYHDGRIPPDNPFVATPGALPSIWTYGHRNPQGLARNPADGAIWATEHGPRGGDELNYLRAGANYGWPVVTHGMNYDGTPVSALTAAEGMVQPVLYWTPSIAASAIHFYSAEAFPKWRNHLFLGSLAQQELHRLVVDGERIVHSERILAASGRVRDIATGPDGLLYLALERVGADGAIVRLVPESD